MAADGIWWGFSEQHGWVVLNRNWPLNRHGEFKGKLTFVRCSDWSLIEVEARLWRGPEWTFAPRRLEALSGVELLREKQVLEELTREFESRAEALREQLVELRHGEFLAAHGQPDSNLVRVTTRHRSANCWNCSRGIDNEVNLECRRCGWIVCWCGACGCGYGYSGYHRAFGREPD